MITEDADKRRTKRRYAHELYPHAAEGETRSLAVEVPYLYARAMGLDVSGTGWLEASPSVSSSRINLVIDARKIAFLADALFQGLSGDEAWVWAASRANDETGEIVWGRANFYGVPIERIKPYPCGPASALHEHVGEPDGYGMRPVTFAPGTEADCKECTEDSNA